MIFKKLEKKDPSVKQEKSPERQEQSAELLQEIQNILHRIESIPTEMGEQFFAFHDAHQALQDIRTALENNDTFSARRHLDRLIEDYGEDQFNLKTLSEHITAEGQDSEQKQTSLYNAAQQHYTGICKKISSFFPSIGKLVRDSADTQNIIDSINQQKAIFSPLKKIAPIILFSVLVGHGLPETRSSHPIPSYFGSEQISDTEEKTGLVKTHKQEEDSLHTLLQEIRFDETDEKISEVFTAFNAYTEFTHTEIAHRLIDVGEEWFVAAYLSRFEGIDHTEIAHRMIERKKGWYLVEHFSNFKGLDHKEIAYKLIERGYGYLVIENSSIFECFEEGIEEDVVYKLALGGEGMVVIENFQKFDNFDHNLFAYIVIEGGWSRTFVNHITMFKDLDAIVAGVLIRLGYAVNVVNHLSVFKESDHEKIAEKLFSLGEVSLVETAREHFWESEKYFGKLKKKFPGAHLVSDIVESKFVRGSVSPADVRGITLMDPAFSSFTKIDPGWIPKEHLPNNESAVTAEHMLMIARNLFFQYGLEVPVTQEVVEEESKKIMMMREKLKDVEIFSERNVVVIAGNESGEDDYRDPSGYRFAPDKTVEEIKRQQGAGYSLKRFRLNKSESKAGSAKGLKEKILSAITETEGALTIVIDAHGTEQGFYLSGNFYDADDNRDPEWNRISFYEFADALSDRHSKFPNSNDPVIIVYSSCFGNNQFRSMCDSLDKNIPKPIGILAAEYGQYAYSNMKSDYQSEIIDLLMLNAEDGSTMKNAIKNSLKHNIPLGVRSTTPSILAPDEQNNLMQISQGHKINKDDNLSGSA